MSAEEHGEQQAEQRSRVKLTRNAKGDAQWEISVVDGADQNGVLRLGEIALTQHVVLMRSLVDPSYDATRAETAADRDEVPF